jgi:hypothetical protein
MTKIKHLHFVCLALGCIAAFSSCVTFIKPLSIPQKKIGKDVRLIGRWTGKIPDKTIHGTREEQVLIDFRSKSERAIEVSFTGEGSLSNFNNLILRVVTVKMEHRNYAILYHPSAQDYFIAMYEINGDQLIIWMVDSQKAEKLINKGELKGVVRRDGFIGFKSVVVTDSSRTITRLIKSSTKDDLFLRVGEFQRVVSK